KAADLAGAVLRPRRPAPRPARWRVAAFGALALVLVVALAVVVALHFFPRARRGGDQQAIQGEGRIVSLQMEGPEGPADEPVRNSRWTFRGDHLLVRDGGLGGDSVFKLDPSRNPKWIDAAPATGAADGMAITGVYELDGDTLTICTP